MKKIKYYIIFFACIFLTYHLQASVLILQNGDILTGKIIKETNDKFVFQNDFGRLNVKKKTVKSVILNEKSLALSSFEDNGKKYKGRIIVRSEVVVVYLLEDNTIYRLTLKKKSAEFPHIFGLAFSGGFIGFPEPVFGTGSQPASMVRSKPQFIWGLSINYNYYFSVFSLGGEAGISKLDYTARMKQPESKWQLSYDYLFLFGGLNFKINPIFFLTGEKTNPALFYIGVTPGLCQISGNTLISEGQDELADFSGRKITGRSIAPFGDFYLEFNLKVWSAVFLQLRGGFKIYFSDNIYADNHFPERDMVMNSIREESHSYPRQGYLRLQIGWGF